MSLALHKTEDHLSSYAPPQYTAHIIENLRYYVEKDVFQHKKAL